MASALATGFLRIAADQHYTTDVITGWASGALFGYVLPTHFRFSPLQKQWQALSAFTPMLGPHVYGLNLSVRF